MTFYEKTLASLKEVKTISSHMTALGKIRASTEDIKFIGFIDKVIKELAELHKMDKTKSTHISLDSVSEVTVKNLVQYCKETIGSKKPEWQIMAERNGWIPPKQ